VAVKIYEPVHRQTKREERKEGQKVKKKERKMDGQTKKERLIEAR